MNDNSIIFDTSSISPQSFQIFDTDGHKIDSVNYQVNYVEAKIILNKNLNIWDSLLFSYRTIPINLKKTYQHKDSSTFIVNLETQNDSYKYTAKSNEIDFFGNSNIRKSGSISRGVSFGNKQSLSVNSTLNLQLSGKLTNNLNISASISDDNIPIQASGNTNKLDEFDQVFIKIYNDRFSLIGGDFFLKTPTGYFMKYQKKAQGAAVHYEFSKYKLKPNLTEKEKIDIGYWKTRASGAFSKGKFARNIIQGIEANQGPYRLRGEQNEPFIIILSGTEQVYIDGKLLTRGQQHDYIIDYNSGEIIFTSNQIITKDKRITVEFQYSDRNFARSLFDGGIEYKSNKLNFWANAYSEQDAKNQPVLQELTDNQKKTLSNAGDNIINAFSNSIDSIGFEDNQVLYWMTDSLGYDSVLVYNSNPDSAVYRAFFTLVGQGKGNYIFSNHSALGRVYKWIKPINGIPQGNYEPVIALIAPQMRQMFSTGANYKINKNLNVDAEISLSNFDLNTFSKLDSKDNVGIGATFNIINKLPIGKNKKWDLKTGLAAEFISKHFNSIERYRAVEFTRNWNTRFSNYEGNELLSIANLELSRKKIGYINYQFQNYLVGNLYQGYQNKILTKVNFKRIFIKFDGSILNSKGIENTLFFRHKSNVFYSFNKIKIGFQDEHELNKFNKIKGILEKQSFRFYDWQFYLMQSDSSKNKYKIYYRQREDFLSDSSTLKYSSIARNIGGEYHLIQLKKHKFRIKVNYRKLRVVNKALINQNNENTILGRIEYRTNIANGGVAFGAFYEVGSGLELRREFIYLEVAPGQGIYSWIDYNNNGIKELNEFEIAVFQDQANYIRTFIPSNNYIQAFNNQFSASLFIKPKRMWKRKKNKWAKLISKFSNQTILRTDKKTTNNNVNNIFNPFVFNSNDSTIASFSSFFRNTFYFNRTNPVFGANYTYSNINSKTLLANGFDNKKNEFHQLKLRWNISKIFFLTWENRYGNKSSSVDFTKGRNYILTYFETEPSISYQPKTSLRFSFISKYERKINNPDLGGEKADLLDMGIDFRWNQIKKGSIQAKFNVILIKYNGKSNSPLAFEMLNALQPGINLTWSIGFQRKIGKNLQININYNGRKSKESKTIHSAQMEVRANF